MRMDKWMSHKWMRKLHLIHFYLLKVLYDFICLSRCKNNTDTCWTKIITISWCATKPRKKPFYFAGFWQTFSVISDTQVRTLDIYVISLCKRLRLNFGHQEFKKAKTGERILSAWWLCVCVFFTCYRVCVSVNSPPLQQTEVGTL